MYQNIQKYPPLNSVLTQLLSTPAKHSSILTLFFFNFRYFYTHSFCMETIRINKSVQAAFVKVCVVSLRVAILTILSLLVLYNLYSYRFERLIRNLSSGMWVTYQTRVTVIHKTTIYNRVCHFFLKQPEYQAVMARGLILHSTS